MLKHDFLAAFKDAAKVQLIALPGGLTVHVREITAKEKSQFEYELHTKKDAALLTIRERLAALCLSDASGKRLFSDDETKELASLPASVIDVVVEAARKLNGFDLAAPEDTRKNSATAPTTA